MARCALVEKSDIQRIFLQMGYGEGRGMKIDEFIAGFPLAVIGLAILAGMVYVLVDAWPWPMRDLVIFIFSTWLFLGCCYLSGKNQ